MLLRTGVLGVGVLDGRVAFEGVGVLDAAFVGVGILEARTAAVCEGVVVRVTRLDGLLVRVGLRPVSLACAAKLGVADFPWIALNATAFAKCIGGVLIFSISSTRFFAELQ